MPNLRFMGYRPDGTGLTPSSGPMVPVQLCDYYNPTGKNGTYKVIHLSAASRWCGPCSLETSDVSGYNYQTNQRTGPGIAADLAPLGVVFVQALLQGLTTTNGANLDDLQTWVASHQSDFAEVLDPNALQLRDFSDGQTLPWNADIDARSMAILETGVGYVPDLESRVKGWATWTDSHPPME